MHSRCAVTLLCQTTQPQIQTHQTLIAPGPETGGHLNRPKCFTIRMIQPQHSRTTTFATGCAHSEKTERDFGSGPRRRGVFRGLPEFARPTASPVPASSRLSHATFSPAK